MPTVETTGNGRRHLAVRVLPRDLQRIDQLAAAQHLSRTQYVIRASLGELDVSPADERFNDLDSRLLRLERHAGF